MKKYRTTKKYANGGTTPGGKPKTYKDATGTYTLLSNGQKLYEGVPRKKPATPAASAPSKPAAKAAGSKSPSGKYMTEGEVIGAKLKKGDYSGAAKMFGEAIVGAPGELYGAFKRSLR